MEKTQETQIHSKIIDDCIKNGLLVKNHKDNSLKITKKGYEQLAHCIKNFAYALQNSDKILTQSQNLEKLEASAKMTWIKTNENYEKGLINALFWEKLGWKNFLEWAQATQNYYLH